MVGVLPFLDEAREATLRGDSMEMDKSLSVVMGLVFAMVMIGVVAQMAQAATPQPQYTCPICGDKFMTYDELYSHFTISHPAEPITIIWE